MTDAAQGRTILRRRTILRQTLVGVGVGLFVVLAVAIPEALLNRGTKQAQECLATYAKPRSAETPRCESALDLLRIPARLPWTANRARYRAEELRVRIAHNEYVDAAVGKPQREALAHAAEAVDHQATIVQNGSTRFVMKELGPSVGAPDLGREADELGDRRTLVERGEQWFNWRVRLSTLRAALLSGDVDRMKALAKRYVVDDPRDPDIRSAVAAVLCMGPDPAKGAEMLAFIQDDRATRRYEALARNYGEVRGLLTACLAKRDLPPPPVPTNSNAGAANAVEQRALLRLRLVGTPASDASQTTAAATVVRLLEGGPRNPGARLALIAALLAAGTDHDAETIVRYSKPKYDEPPITPSIALTALEWVTDHRPMAGESEPPAILPGTTFLVAAHTLETLEGKLVDPSDKPTESKDDAPTENGAALRPELVSLRGALLLEAAAALTRDGNVDGALTAADDAARVLDLSNHVRSLLRSNVYWLSGDREKAFAALDIDGAVVHNGNAFANKILGALSVQQSELAMSLGKTDVALRAARRAGEFATAAKDPSLFARSKWMIAAHGSEPAATLVPEDLNGATPFPAVGFAHPLEPWRMGDHDKQQALIDRALAPWVSLAKADPTLRRAGRWAALRSRGDVPQWLSVHLFLASRLVDPSDGEPEVWLDALLAFDQRRFSLRSYAFARAEAARMRGDAASAATWDGRFRTLCKVASDVPNYELTRHLDI